MHLLQGILIIPQICLHVPAMIDLRSDAQLLNPAWLALRSSVKIGFLFCTLYLRNSTLHQLPCLRSEFWQQHPLLIRKGLGLTYAELRSVKSSISMPLITELTSIISHLHRRLDDRCEVESYPVQRSPSITIFRRPHSGIPLWRSEILDAPLHRTGMQY